MAGFDPRDSTSVDAPVPDYLASLGAAESGCASVCRRSISRRA
jgi:hypothetical protein